VTKPEILQRAEADLQFTRDCALRLIPHLRLNLRVREHLYSFSLYLSMIDYAAGVVALRGTDGAIAIASITRSVLDIFVDIENIQRDRRFCDYLEYSSNKDTARMLKKAKLDENPYLQSIKDDRQFNETALREAEERIAALEPQIQARRITTESRYGNVNRTHEYDAIFRELSGDVHNSVETAISRRFEVDAAEERLVVRTAPHVRFELPCLILIAEALVNASEIILKMCGHSTAAIGDARERVAALETDATAAYEPPDAN
jgi:Family of unknown function (DUF5677)